MNDMPPRSVLVLLFCSSLIGCVEVGEVPGPEACEVPSEKRCVSGATADEPDQLQICAQDMGWIPVQTCNSGEGCFASPLTEPVCMKPFDCFDIALNFISCDVDDTLQEVDRNPCRLACEEHAESDAYKSVINCYGEMNCQRSVSPYDCVLEECSTEFMQCENQTDSRNQVRAPAGMDAFTSGAADVEVSRESQPDVSAQAGDASLGSNPDATDVAPLDEGPDPDLPIAPAVDQVTCLDISNCWTQCPDEPCPHCDGLPVAEKNGCLDVCEMDCEKACRDDVAASTVMQFMALAACSKLQCQDLSGLQRAACLWTECASSFGTCIANSAYGLSTCTESVNCMVSAQDQDEMVICVEATDESSIEAAVDVYECYLVHRDGTCTSDKETCIAEHCAVESGACGS